jgi:uncharacterized protein (TIGR02265 family)
MAEAHVVYQSVFEGLLTHTVGKRMTPALREKLKAIGMDPEQLKPTYPKDLWQKVIDAICAGLYPSMKREDAMFKLGTEMVEGYRATLLGKVQMQMVKMLGPRRTMERAGPQFRAGNNFSEVRLTKKSDSEYEMWMNEVAESAPFTRGSLVGLLKMAGAKDVKVDVKPDVNPAATFHIRWTE